MTNKSKMLENKDIIILLPVFNDWKAMQMLLISLDEVLLGNNLQAVVIAVDDGSTVLFREELDLTKDYKAIKQFDVLQLGRNLGHQRAIAIAISYIEEKIPCEAVVVMDADGEDNPKYIPLLIEKYNQEKQKKIIFAQRVKRSENLFFKIFYGLYKKIYRIFTGSKIRVGNFCVLPYKTLSKIVLVSEIWNHFPAGILKAKIPYTEIPIERSSRLSGHSQMNFLSLIMHGLSAISVHADTLGIRALIATSFTMFVAVLATSWVVSVKLFTNLAIPGWASTLVLLFFLIFMQSLSISIFFIFIVLSGRNNLNFLPKRDYHYFIQNLHRIFPKT